MGQPYLNLWQRLTLYPGIKYEILRKIRSMSHSQLQPFSVDGVWDSYDYHNKDRLFP